MYLNKHIRFFLKYVYFLFIYLFWLCWVFIAARRLSLLVASRGYSSLQCTGFSLWWLLLLRSMVTRLTGFSSCSTWAQQLWLTGSRAQAQQLWHKVLVVLQHVGSSQTRALTHVLAGRFLTTVPPRKSKHISFCCITNNQNISLAFNNKLLLLLLLLFLLLLLLLFCLQVCRLTRTTSAFRSTAVAQLHTPIQEPRLIGAAAI